jgi:hypothetical protein
MPEGLASGLTGDEVLSFTEWISVITGFQVVPDWTLGPIGVAVDHDQFLIRINGCLDPAAAMLTLSRTCKWIAEGVGSDSAFRPKLRLVR